MDRKLQLSNPLEIMKSAQFRQRGAGLSLLEYGQDLAVGESGFGSLAICVESSHLAV